MARPLSAASNKVLRQLGRTAKSLDELAARTGIRKDRVAKLLWHLEARGWIAVSEETRRLPVYRRLRQASIPKRKDPKDRASHFTELYAAFRMRLPSKRARGRVVRGE